MAYNLITGSGNFTDASTDCAFGSASWTGSITADELYVRGFLKTDIYYDIPASSSVFTAKMYFDPTQVANYVYAYTGAVSGSVTDLQSGSYADYYVETYWGVAYDYFYSWNTPPIVQRSLDSNGNWADIAGGAWKQGWKMALLRHKSDNRIASMCAVYPVDTGAGAVVQEVSPGVNGYFLIHKTSAAYPNLLADFQNDLSAGTPKKAELRIISTEAILATTIDAPPAPEPPPVDTSFNIASTAGFFFP